MKTTIIISLFPFNQGAFKACARVSELQVFTHTAEVKVDPDKPLEGVRLAVLQVALCERQQQPDCFTLYNTHDVKLKAKSDPGKELRDAHKVFQRYRMTANV